MQHCMPHALRSGKGIAKYNLRESRHRGARFRPLITSLFLEGFGRLFSTSMVGRGTGLRLVLVRLEVVYRSKLGPGGRCPALIEAP